MRRRFSIMFALVLTLAMSFTGVALAFDSGGNPGDYPGDSTIQWTGQGADGGVLDTAQCDENNTPYLLWIFTTDGGGAHDATLHLGGTGSGNYSADKTSGNTFHFLTPYVTPDSNLTAYATFTVDTTGNGAWNLVISHGCAGPDLKPLTASKTAEGSYDRTITWELTKSVSPDSYAGSFGQSLGTSQWTVTATKHEENGNYKVTGTITVRNPNAVAVPVTIGDKLSDDTVATVTCPGTGDNTGTVPAKVGSTDGSLTCDYIASPADATADKNNATVESGYQGVDGATASADVTWKEHVIGDDTVVVDDDRNPSGFPATISDSQTWTYNEPFACSSDVADYGTKDSITTNYPNKATLTGDNTKLSADAKVTVICTATWKSETATAQGLQWSKVKGAPNTWFMYTQYTTAKVDLIAGQFYDAGDISMSRPGDGNTYITIKLHSGYRFANVLSNLKIQPLNSQPTAYVQPGAFQYKFTEPQSTTIVTVAIPGTSATYYGIAADVQRIVVP